jgi:hypothetical protein
MKPSRQTYQVCSLGNSAIELCIKTDSFWIAFGLDV